MTYTKQRRTFGRALEYTKSGFGAGGDGHERLGTVSFMKKTEHSSFYEASLGNAQVIIQIRPNEKGWVDVFVQCESRVLSLKIVKLGDDEFANLHKMMKMDPLHTYAISESFKEDATTMHKLEKGKRVVFSDAATAHDIDLAVRLTQGVVAFLLDHNYIDNESLVVTGSTSDDINQKLEYYNYQRREFYEFMVNEAKTIATGGTSSFGTVHMLTLRGKNDSVTDVHI